MKGYSKKKAEEMFDKGISLSESDLLFVLKFPFRMNV